MKPASMLAPGEMLKSAVPAFFSSQSENAVSGSLHLSVA
jgi:hypothetical protein